jgi:hypothetical protein
VTTSRPRARRSLAVLAAGPVALSLTGCGVVDRVLPPEEPDRDASGEVTAASDADIFAVALGDCLDMSAMRPEAEEFTSLPIVPCSKPHTGEVYAELTLSDDDYPDEFPGAKAIASVADEFCLEEFEPFVGATYEDSVLDYWQFWPTKLSWAEGDRVLQCVVESAEPVTGTLEGAGI